VRALHGLRPRPEVGGVRGRQDELGGHHESNLSRLYGSSL
jgi:hypothetical protein